MKNKLFNVVVYGLLVYSIFTGIHAALPVEYQITGFTNLTALVSGASTALVGSAGLAIKSWLTSAKITADTKQVEVYKEFLKLTEQYQALKTELSDNKKLSHEQFVEQQKKLERLIGLVEADLKAKLSTKLIDEKVERIIKEGLDNEKDLV